MTSHAAHVRCDLADGGWSCHVTVTSRGTTTTHDVFVATADLARLDTGAPDPADLVRRSFDFLLAREPNTSILRRFNLTLIGSYFPDWEPAIRR